VLFLILFFYTKLRPIIHKLRGKKEEKTLKIKLLEPKDYKF